MDTLDAMSRYAIEWLGGSKACWLVIVFLDPAHPEQSPSVYACMFDVMEPRQWAAAAALVAFASVVAIVAIVLDAPWRLPARLAALSMQAGLFVSLAWLAACGTRPVTSMVFGDFWILTVAAIAASARVGLSMGRDRAARRIRQ